MGSTWNPNILVDKLAKLNSSQQSIETLSHWCIFHMNKAKQVVETWDRQFHCVPRDQRLAFLYLANDILQNSRRKGSEFVGEFWKVLPDALRDVIGSGDQSGRSAALRLINIWAERKVFGSRGQILKEELIGRHPDINNRNGKHPGLKLKHYTGNALERIVSGYEVIYGGQFDEDAIFSKCANAISCVEKVDKEIYGDVRSGQVNGSGIVEDLKSQHSLLGDCIEQLTEIESSRANLVSYLREALQEQDFKLNEVRNQLQAAQSRSEQAGNLCRQLQNANTIQFLSESIKESHTSKLPQSYASENPPQSVTYTRQAPVPEKPAQAKDNTKVAVAAVAAKLTSSTSSAQVLTYVLSSLASEGVIGNVTKESSSNDYAVETKRPKIENDQLCSSSYVPLQISQPPLPPFPHPDAYQHINKNVTLVANAPNELPPPPPPSPPPPPPPLPLLQPYPITQFVPYSYGSAQNQPPPLPTVSGAISSFPPLPANSYQNYQMENAFYSQPSSVPTAPMPRQ